jgi:hypothetical protein
MRAGVGGCVRFAVQLPRTNTDPLAQVVMVVMVQALKCMARASEITRLGRACKPAKAAALSNLFGALTAAT